MCTLTTLVTADVPLCTVQVAISYDELFGRRSVQLVLSARDGHLQASRGDMVGRRAGRSLGFITFCVYESGAAFDAKAPEVERSYVVFDPLVATCHESLVLLPNVLACSQERCTVDARATSLVCPHLQGPYYKPLSTIRFRTITR